MTRRRRFPLFLAVAAIAASAGSPLVAGDFASDMKKAGQSVGKAATKFGHEVAETGKKVGTTVADATEEGAKNAWYETKKWTTRESKRVADASVKWWDDVIHGKEAKRDQLRRENESLKKKRDG